MTTLFTIGHSTRPLDELLALLRAHDIERVVDVRRFPGSRKHPQFNRASLAAALAAAGIEYVHEEALGGRRAVVAGSPNTAWRNRSFQAYADHMTSAEFRAALARLESGAARRRSAVMCAEAVPWRCHRRLIADVLVAHGVDVRHIIDATRLQPHELHAAARRRPDGTLVYPDSGDQLELTD